MTYLVALGDAGTLISIVLMLGLMYLIIFLPQRRKDKKLKQMRSEMQIGDEIVTIGGIVGRIVSVKDDTVVVETGTDRSKIRFKTAAIETVNKLELDDKKTAAKSSDKKQDVIEEKPAEKKETKKKGKK